MLPIVEIRYHAPPNPTTRGSVQTAMTDDGDRFEEYERMVLADLLAEAVKTPDDALLHQFIGRGYVGRRDCISAIRYFKRAIKLDPSDAWNHLYLGDVWCRLRRYADAMESFRTALRLMPEVACPYWCLADVHFAVGDHDQAGEFYRKACDVDAEDPTAKQRLSDWLARTTVRSRRR